MAVSRLALLVLVAIQASWLTITHTQTIHSVNNSIYFELPGASLILTTESSMMSGSGSASSIASQADVAAAVQNNIATVQPQINAAFMLLNSTTSRVESVATSLSGEQTRAMSIESSLAISVGAQQTRAMGVEASLATASASAVTSEAQRATGVEGSLATSITTERTRATGVESSIATSVATELTRATGVEASLATATTASINTANTRALTVEGSLAVVLAQTQATLVATQSSLVSLTTDHVSLSQQLTRMLNCSSRGLFADAYGNCISGSGSGSSSSSGTTSTVAGCPGNSVAGGAVVPICMPGFSPMSSQSSACSGANQAFPTSFTCSAVACPILSTGINVPSGCTCFAGLNGTVIATNSSPFYYSTCGHLPCPVNSTGVNLASGCQCKPGFSGSVNTTLTDPYYVSNCRAVSCPVNSSGASISAGCTCLAGFSGVITATQQFPFYNGSCTAVACPAGSVGTTVPSGCTCASGYAGGPITATLVPPYYNNPCILVACPTNAVGAPSCACSSGYSGTLTFAGVSWSGTCSLAACPANAAGAPNCQCNSGYAGTLTFSGGVWSGTCLVNGVVWQSTYNNAQVRSYVYNGGSTTLTWQVQHDVCATTNGKQTPGTSNSAYWTQYCSYSSTDNYIVTSGCNWGSQTFNWISGSLTAGTKAYMCTHTTCNIVIYVTGTSITYSAGTSTINPGDSVFCSP